MSLNTLIKMGINTLLGGPIVETLAKKAKEKAVSIFQEKFIFTAFEIAKLYQESYTYALAAIGAGLVDNDQKRAFLQKLTGSKVEREFAEQIEQDYLQPFAAQHGEALPALRQQFLEKIKKLTQQPPIFSGKNHRLSESELVAIVNEKGTLAITDLILAQLRDQKPKLDFSLDDQLFAFLRYNDLLGKATLFFLHDLLRKDDRAKTTLATLQREGILLEVRDLKSSQEQILKRLQQQLDEQNASAAQALQAGDISKVEQLTPELKRLQNAIKIVPNELQAAATAWKRNHQEWIEFSERFNIWAGLLKSQLVQVLEETGKLHGKIEAVHQDVKANLAKAEEISDDVNELKQKMAELMARFALSAQIKPSDEFTHHNSTSLELIQAAIAELNGLPSRHPDYNEMVIMAGSMLSSTGNIAAAEKLFEKARDAAEKPAEKALACFNLFQVRLRNKDYAQALADLQSAIEIDRHYALHDIEKYPIVQLLGAGGMGCVFLCHDQWGEKKVVVKCFWEGRKGTYQEVFGEAMLMRQVAGTYVPEPLDCGYIDAHRQARPYFVTEYIEGALDGETWLAQHGVLDVPTGIAVGIEIAKGLQVAHEKGIFHLDLKPANLLFKRTETGLMVKIIDFGLARVARSLRQEAESRQSASGMTQFGQAIVGTLFYAPPEQMGEGGKPGAKSDLYAFGATLYRLMTGEKPRTLNPRRLAKAPPALFDLLCHCKEENPDLRPDSAQQVVSSLEEIKTSGKQKSQPKSKSFFRGTAIVVIAVVATLIWYYLPQNEISATSPPEVTPTPESEFWEPLSDLTEERGRTDSFEEPFSVQTNGERSFQQKCAACHTIGGGPLIGPDLQGVRYRRDPNWLLRWIQEHDKMLAEGDQIATQLLQEYNIPMPNLSVSESEAREILAYIESQSR
jgi:serine/threonine protein kinase/uncharacterized protein YoxC